MSTHKLGQKLFSLVLWVFFISLLFSLFKQIAVYRRVDKRLSEEQRQLETLEEKNKQLKDRLKEISSSEPVLIQKENLPESENAQNKKVLPIKNYQKWINLFFH